MYKRFAPRIGFAYSVDQKTVLRGGYGLFWIPFGHSVPNRILRHLQSPAVWASRKFLRLLLVWPDQQSEAGSVCA
jgi:hypothetical protein